VRHFALVDAQQEGIEFCLTVVSIAENDGILSSMKQKIEDTFPPQILRTSNACHDYLRKDIKTY